MLIPFIGYALGRRFIGYVECSGERLTDLLNRTESVVIREAFVESFEDDTVVNLGDGEVDRSILYAVETSGARGEETRRISTVRHRLQVQIGPYSALGLLHAAPGQMPLPVPDVARADDPALGRNAGVRRARGPDSAGRRHVDREPGPARLGPGQRRAGRGLPGRAGGHRSRLTAALAPDRRPAAAPDRRARARAAVPARLTAAPAPA